MKLTIGGVVPVTGSSTTKDIEKILSQDDIDVSFVLGGSFYRQKMAVLSASFKSDSEKKTTTEQVVLEGRKPDIS
jgi:phosphoribulokinase